MYSDFKTDELRAMRAKLVTSLHERLTRPTAAAFNGRSASFQQHADDIRREIKEIDLELAAREGRMTRGPIYLV